MEKWTFKKLKETAEKSKSEGPESSLFLLVESYIKEIPISLWVSARNLMADKESRQLKGYEQCVANMMHLVMQSIERELQNSKDIEEYNQFLVIAKILGGLNREQ